MQGHFRVVKVEVLVVTISWDEIDEEIVGERRVVDWQVFLVVFEELWTIVRNACEETRWLVDRSGPELYAVLDHARDV